MSKIVWYGHSAFKIEAHGASVVIDPFFTEKSGCGWNAVCPTDLVLVTHDHGDHTGNAIDICKTCGAALGAVVGTAQALVERGAPSQSILNGIGFGIGGTVECKGMAVTMTQAFHSSDTSVPVGYIIHMPDGLVVYHAGDTGIFASMELLGQLYHIDLALLPIGGVYTMDAMQAAHACKLLGCANVIPMHWGTFPMLAQSPDAFKAQLGNVCPACECIALLPGHDVEIMPEKKK